jgi:hypothetical protein
VRLGQFAWRYGTSRIRPLRATRTLRFQVVTIKSTWRRSSRSAPVRRVGEMSYIGMTV